jgi:hypothetical protein
MVLTREQWAIASRIGHTSTVRDLAWRSALALCDTIECVGRLIRAGLCTLVAAPAASTPPSAAGAAEQGDEPVMLPAPGVPEPLPRRRPGTHLARELSAAAARSGAAAPRPVLPVAASYTPPPPDVLHRLLDGLRNLT